ncbi:MAG: LiaF-related protein [Bacteroides sp.]|jgi:predicted membrane protein|nr:LiaF-related protein [Bacteroides sp.]
MKNKMFRRSFWGGLFILVGVLYLLFNVGALSIVWKPIVFSWQMFLVVLGVIWFFTHRYFWGVLIAAIGVISLLPQLSEVMGFDYSQTMLSGILWPLVIIFFGIMIITHSFTHHHLHERWCRGNFKRQAMGKTDMDGKIDYNYIFSGLDEIFLRPVFRGGEINTICGGVKLDLRKTSLPEGDTVLEINSICGGVELWVPQNWTVEIRPQSFLGGFADRRGYSAEVKETDRKLIIVASLIMGGGDVRC